MLAEGMGHRARALDGTMDQGLLLDLALFISTGILLSVEYSIGYLDLLNL